MKLSVKTRLFVGWVILFAGICFGQGYMAHEQVAVSSVITYNQRGFSIQGKPAYIYAGEIHFPRIPRELWKERLVKIKRAGYNTVSSYTFWSLHEPIQGQFHFEDNLDVDAWLSLIDSLGMYSIMRVGPYICAETDFGGFPAWLADVPNMKYRVSTGPFLGCVDKYWEKLFPIILKHQISKGGSLISVQLENEYYYPADLPADPAYEKHIVDKAVSLGIEIPYTWSMCINGNQVWKSLTGSPFTNPNKFPWFATEFWMGWFDENGEPTATEKYNAEFGTWQFISFGTGGICHYMINGGTNFGYTASDDNQNTSYDYHAPIGECGQFRSQYWTLKQAGLFTRTFEPILSTSTNGASQITLSPATGLNSFVHTTPSSGTIAIIQNPGTAAAGVTVTWKNKNITVPTTGKWTIPSEKFCHFLSDVPVTNNLTIDYSATGVMTINKYGSKNYMVLYGTSGTSGEIAFVYKNAPAVLPIAPWTWTATAKRASLVFTYPKDDSISEVTLSDGVDQTVNVLIMSTNQALNHTWVADKFLASGPDFVDESDNLLFGAAGGKGIVYNDTGKLTVIRASFVAPVEKPLTSGWKWSTATLEASTSYDDSKWLSHTGGIDMASFGWPNGYGWYRYTYNAASAGTATFAFVGAVEDASKLFVNGVYSTNAMAVKSGANTIAIMVADYSRSKEFGNYSLPKDVDKSGILNGFSINGTQVSNAQVKFRGGFDGIEEAPMVGTISTSSWTALVNRSWNSIAAPDDNAPKFWLNTFDFTLPVNGYQTWILNGSVTKAGRGVVWLNGHCIGRNLENQGVVKQFPLFIPQCWLKNGSNTLVVLTEDGKAPQNYRLTPVADEYRSLGIQSTVIREHDLSNKASVQPRSNESFYTMHGTRFVIPKAWVGKQFTCSVFDLSGKLLKTLAVNHNVIELPAMIQSTNNVFIVKLKMR